MLGLLHAVGLVLVLLLLLQLVLVVLHVTLELLSLLLLQLVLVLLHAGMLVLISLLHVAVGADVVACADAGAHIAADRVERSEHVNEAETRTKRERNGKTKRKVAEWSGADPSLERNGTSYGRAE